MIGDRPLVDVLDFARNAGIPCLEVVADPGSKHIDPATFDAAKADEVKQMLAERKLEISGLACFLDACQPGGARSSRATPGRWSMPRCCWACPRSACKPACRCRT